MVGFLLIICLISLLKCGLARLFLYVNFQVTFSTHNYNCGHGYGHFWCPKLVIWQAWCSTLAPWGTMGRSRDSWEDTKGHLGVQTWIFIDFWWISGPHFESFSGTLNQNRCLFSCLFPGHFSKRFWGLNLDVWCLKNKHLVWEGLQKPIFHRSWHSVVSRVNF